MSDFRGSSAKIAALRAKVAAIESGGQADAGVLPFGDVGLDDRLPGGGLPLGRWHEIVSPGLETAAPVEQSAAGPLSQREREILILVAEGLSGPMIADRLGLKSKTIENHRARIMEKLGIHTTAGLVRYALRTGLAR